jgi:tetratricopeptide (TPR) repeat protein
VELDPLCLTVGTSAAWVHYVAGDYHAAEERCRQYADLDRRYGYSAAYRLLGAVYLQMGRHDDAITVLRQALAERSDEPVLVAWLAHALGAVGHRTEAASMLSRIQPGTGVRIAGYHLVLAAVGAGAHDLAFESLERALEDRESPLIHLGVEPRWAPLHRTPRFERLLTTLRLTVPRTTGMRRVTPPT